MVLDVVTALSFLTLVSGIVVVLYFLELVAYKMGIIADRLNLWNWLGARARGSALIVALVSMLGSLYFSDVLHYAPCVLCWYQRILMYPQVFLFATALVKRDRTEIWRYAVVLSVLGAIIAGFHYISQVSDFSLPCSAIGYSVSCSETFFLRYGYITIPVMALTAFILILILSYLAQRHVVNARQPPHLKKI